jgi:hypothetical protein
LIRGSKKYNYCEKLIMRRIFTKSFKNLKIVWAQVTLTKTGLSAVRTFGPLGVKWMLWQYIISLLGPALLKRVFALCCKNNIWSKCLVLIQPLSHYLSQKRLGPFISIITCFSCHFKCTYETFTQLFAFLNVWKLSCGILYFCIQHFVENIFISRIFN